MVKEDRARAVGDQLIKMATTGQLKAKVSEEQLISMLEQTGEKKTKVTIQRRRFDESDEDDNDDDLL